MTQGAKYTADTRTAATLRVALITGAARRIGAQIARELHADGWCVALHYRQSAEAAQELATELESLRPDSAATLQADLLDRAGHERLIEQAQQIWGQLDALVNNASSYYPTPIGSIDESAFDDLMGSNFKAPLFLSQAFAGAVTQGSIVNIVDIHVQAPMCGFAAYSAAKGALDTLSRALARELAPRIRVNAVAPGHIIWSEHETLSDAQMRAESERIPMQRLGSPEDVAHAVRFLLSDEAAYITGVTLPVDGGLRLT